ncbi:hypothetical protein D3C71_1615640 [compost metagenome]
MQHVREVGGGVDGVGKGLCLDDKFRELDLVERAHAVGQLHTGLKALVALAGRRGFPLLGGFVQAFDRKRLAACAACGWQRGQGGVARHHVFRLQGRNDVDQCVQPGAALQRERGHGHLQGIVHIPRVLQRVRATVQPVVVARRHRRSGSIEPGFLPSGGLGRIFRVWRQSTLGRVAARGPGVVGHDEGQHQAADDGQTQLQCAHG